MNAQAEAERLAALFDYDVLDTAPEEAFDRLTRTAAEIFDAPIALVSLIDAERQWFKSKVGLSAESTPRDWAFCAHAIEGGHPSTMVVEDATEDPRFAANPLVTGDPNIRFYAGATLTTAGGQNLGTLCIIDDKPRVRPSPEQLERLQRLADMVVAEMDNARDRRRALANQMLLELVEHISGVGHWRIDGPQLKLTWSDETYRIHGVEQETFHPDFGKAGAFFVDEDRMRHAQAVLEAFQTGLGYEMQVKLKRADGAIRDVMLRTRTQVEANGTVTGLFGVIQDITAHLQGLKAIERSRSRYRLLADNMADAVTRIRLDGSSTYISPGIFKLLGYRPMEMAGKSSLAFVWPDDRPLLEKTFAAMGEGLDEKTVQHRAQHKDGRPVWVESRFRLVRDANGAPFEMVTVIRDIGDRKAAEIALEESEARYRLLADYATDIISRTHPHGEVLYVTPSIEAVTGFTPAEVVGTNILDRLHPEDMPDFIRCYGEVIRRQRPAGTPIRYRVRTKSGAWIWMEGNPRLVLGADGKPVEVVDVLRDVTEQVRLEHDLKEARDEADAAAHAKSDFLANMSHELRTPLSAIIGFSGLMKAQTDLPPQAAMFARRIEGASQALLATINDILDFSKLEAGQVEIRPRPTDVAALVAEVEGVLEQQASTKGLALTSDLAGLPPRLEVDPDRIRQVLLNLVGNAVKFTAEGEVRVGGAYADGRLVLHVVDTGPGLAPAQQELLFKRFSQVDGSSTRSHGGTGLGLAICKGLVEAMGGEIGVTSAAGEGATFTFALPCHVAQAPAEARPA